jgi:hypothetical protein
MALDRLSQFRAPNGADVVRLRCAVLAEAGFACSQQQVSWAGVVN